LAAVIESPPVTGSTSSVSAATSSGSFFYGRPSCPEGADALGWPSGQVCLEFLPPAADGIDVQTRDARHHGIAAVAELLGLEGGEPAALLLVEAAA
jgi:hypothetical protein